jgi:Resolvase, N terminal domain
MVRHIREQGWELVDEYCDGGESARSADRHSSRTFSGRIIEQRDVDGVLVHKIDRLARNIEHQLLPIGYRNVREKIGHRRVALIGHDPERTPLVNLAFKLDAAG